MNDPISLIRRSVKLMRLAATPLYRKALRYGVGAAIEHERALALTLPAVILDVGANRGQFSLVARQAHPRAQIHAFEPLAAEAETYGRLFASQPNVTLHRLALGRRNEKGVLYVSGRHDSSSLLPIGEGQVREFPDTALESERPIEVVRGGDLEEIRNLSAPILIKLDVQGYELEALAGLEDIFSKVKWIYCEVSFVSLYDGQPLAAEVVKWLASRGFGISGVFNLSQTSRLRPLQADMLFAAEERRFG